MRAFSGGVIGCAGLAALAAGCATYPISRQYLEQTPPGLTFAQVLSHPDPYQGTTVVWGGQILELTNTADGSELTLMQMPLNVNLRPVHRLATLGRFLAKTPNFLDPEVFRKGSRVTLAGILTGRETRPLDKMQYTYPVLNIEQIHVWPPRIHYRTYYYDWGWSYPYPSWDWEEPSLGWGWDESYGHDWDSHDRE